MLLDWIYLNLKIFRLMVYKSENLKNCVRDL